MADPLLLTTCNSGSFKQRSTTVQIFRARQTPHRDEKRYFLHKMDNRFCCDFHAASEKCEADQKVFDKVYI